MKNKDRVFFIKRLSFLTKAGVPVSESLEMIREQTRSKKYIAMFGEIAQDVSHGQPLATALGKFRKAFGEFSINIISFGEQSGILSDNLEYLAEELRKKEALKRKVIGAFIYPMVVTCATIGITVFLMVYLFPKIVPVFTSLRIALPLSTRIVIALSNFIRFQGWWVLILLILAGIGVTLGMRYSPRMRFHISRWILKIPIIGLIIRDYNLANATRTLGLLLRSGITVSDALEIVTRTTGNLVYKFEFDNLAQIIERGGRMSQYLVKRPKLFPEIMAQIVSVGERSGNLPHSLVYLSEMYESEVDDFTKNLSNLVEPAMMIVMGLMVGFIAISIITPIYSITSNLHA